MQRATAARPNVVRRRGVRVLFRVLPILLATSVLGSAWAGASAPGNRSLSLEDRVAAQTAIERVYWAHRIWPKENPGPKPPLEEVMPESTIRAKVEDYLKKSNALERFWGRPITGRPRWSGWRRVPGIPSSFGSCSRPCETTRSSSPSALPGPSSRTG